MRWAWVGPVCVVTLSGCLRGSIGPGGPPPNTGGTAGAPAFVTVSARLDPADLSVGHFTVSWSAVAGAQSYTLYYAQDAGLTPDNVGDLPGGGTLPDAVSPVEVTVAGTQEVFFVVGVVTGGDTLPYSAAVPARALPSGANGLVPLDVPAFQPSNTGDPAGFAFGYPTWLIDANGDGYADLITADHQRDDTNASLIDVGRVYIYRGGPDGLAATPQAFSAPVPDASELFGLAYPAGDINHDTVPDFIVGAPDYNTVGGGIGRAFLYLGGTGLGDPAATPTPAWRREADAVSAEYYGRFAGSLGDVDGDTFDDWAVSRHEFSGVTDTGGRVDFYPGTDTNIGNVVPAGMIGSPDNGANLGWGLAPLPGDPDGDGDPDLLVGARFDATNNEGQVFLHLDNGGALDATAGWSVEGNVDELCYGYAVAWAGDVDGDGRDDALVGGPGCGLAGATMDGLAHLYRGTAAGLEAAPAWALTGTGLEGLGEAVATLGDLNGDGIDDFAIGSRAYDPGALADAGRAQLFLGVPDGVPTAAPQWQVVGDVADGHLGGAIGGAGDVNGDGAPDLAIGITGLNLVLGNGHTNRSVLVFYGPPRATPAFTLPTGALQVPAGAVSLSLEATEPASFPAGVDTHTCTVDWGDGGGPETAACALTAHALTLTATHAYGAAGDYTVHARIANAYGDPALYSEIAARLHAE